MRSKLAEHSQAHVYKLQILRSCHAATLKNIMISETPLWYQIIDHHDTSAALSVLL